MFDLEFIEKEIKSHLDENGIERRIWKEENISYFTERGTYAISLIREEKEIIVFSALQWAAIGASYYIWAQILGWIPNEVWESDSKLYDIPLNIAFLIWSFACVALAAYPISILTAAMGAAHLLRQQGGPSTIAACLRLAIPNSKALWMFHTADGWLTVDMILERLPKRDYFTNPAKHALKEAAYNAWKIGTIGMPAALLTGKALIDAGKDSISLVKDNPMDAIMLRGGYSVACWTIGVIGYIGSILFFIKYNHLFESNHAIFTFYLWMGVPLLIAVGIIKLFIRPIYVIASCKLYSDYLLEKGKTVTIKHLPSKAENALTAFILLCILLTTVILYREEIGLMDILRVITL